MSELTSTYDSGIVYYKVRFLASIVGQIISTQAVFDNQARLRTRFLYDGILSRASWNANVMISNYAVKEYTFWLNNVDSTNEIGASFYHLTYNDKQKYHIFL